MPVKSVQDLFVEELRDIHSAERQLTKALPRMAKAAQSPQLRQAFERHLKETEGQIERLDRIFKELDARATGKRCKGMEGLLEEGKEMMEEEGDASVIDAGLISAAQRVEHYEIAAYGCVRNYADMLGYKNAARLLQQNLDEEEAADKKLTELAEGGVNSAAMAAAGSQDEEE